MEFWRIAVIVIDYIFLIWFILPIFYGMLKAGNILGIVICAVVFFRTALYSFYDDIVVYLTQHGWGFLPYVLDALMVLFCIYAVIVSACMVWAMKKEPAANATALILGAEVKPWGPSRLLRQRIDAAYKYMKKEFLSFAVGSGGKSDHEIISEGECIRDHLIKYGIAPERVFAETRSVNTDENIRFSFKIIKEQRLGSDVAIVTDSYHQLRARIIARRTDKDIRVGACCTKQTWFGIMAYPTYFLREWIAIPVELLKRR